MIDHTCVTENTDRLWVLYFDEELPLAGQATASFVLGGRVSHSKHGVNSLLIESDSVWGERVLDADGIHLLPQPMRFESQRLTRAQCEINDQLVEALDRILTGRLRPNLRPVIYFVEAGQTIRCYAAVETTARHQLALRFCTLEHPHGDHDYSTVKRIWTRSMASFAERLPLLNSRFGYFQWRSDMEFERKFTFKDLPDTWSLVVDLYTRLYEGTIPGFFPECHKGFQVFDYENHIFDIFGEPAELGYISFIPQVNNNVTIKRKWFQENAEIRRESLWWNQKIGMSNFSDEAEKRVGAHVTPLPVFRRKRFDVNFESLKTGHVYGVYFDICRTIDAKEAHFFGQVEVEYCRSRTAFPLEDVFEEFNYLAEYVERLLSDANVLYKEDLFSKLDFSRQSQLKNKKSEQS